jgi:hypothetical protein
MIHIKNENDLQFWLKKKEGIWVYPLTLKTALDTSKDLIVYNFPMQHTIQIKSVMEISILREKMYRGQLCIVSAEVSHTQSQDLQPSFSLTQAQLLEKCYIL